MMNESLFFFNFMGKAICEANGNAARGRMQVGNPAIIRKQRNSDFSDQTT
jgi:hypothetical protein